MKPIRRDADPQHCYKLQRKENFFLRYVYFYWFCCRIVWKEIFSLYLSIDVPKCLFLGKNMIGRRTEADPGVRTERRKRKGKGKSSYFFSFLHCFLTEFFLFLLTLSEILSSAFVSIGS